MDPRLLLGLDTAAGRAEADRAARRLAAALDPTTPGADELRRLLRAAVDVISSRGPGSSLSIDPYKVLGLRPADGHDANVVKARAAFRRLALMTHPDHGGTDELFRVVEAAYDVVVHPFARVRAGRGGADPWDRPVAEPPGPPPPPGPFVARPADARNYPSKARAGLVVGIGSMVLAVGAVAAVVLVKLVGMKGLPLIALLGGLFALAAASGSGTFLRSVVVLAGTRVRHGSDADPDRFLEACCLDSPVGREHEDVLYRAYERWCRERRVSPISPWRFVEHLRSLGLLYVRSSAWESGMWVGLRRRDA